MSIIIDNWYYIVLAAVFLIGGIISTVRFILASKEEKYQMIQGWLLQAVLLAEREFGSGTGSLKLSSVYDKFCERFPWLAKAITFEMFSGYVDDALDNMRVIISHNNAIASIVETKGEN